MAAADLNVRGKRALSLLIQSNVVKIGDPVYYKSKNKGGRIGQGWITENGVMCRFCNQRLTLTGFEHHVGSNKHRPSSNIFLEDGRSLSDCLDQLKGEGAGAESDDKDVVVKEEHPCRTIKLFGTIIPCHGY